MVKFCGECTYYYEEDYMISTTGKLSYHAEVCKDCYDKLESDADDYEEVED